MSKRKHLSKDQKRKIKLEKRKSVLAKRNSRPPLWSVQHPNHNLPSFNGKVRLYHFTKGHCLGSILKYGIIVGDTIADPDIHLPFNCPNLTSEGQLHNPGGINSLKLFNELDTLRLDVWFDESDDRIINYDWFDRTYANGISKKVVDAQRDDGLLAGNLEKQFIFKGEITPEMIKKISRWDSKTEAWVELSLNEIKVRTDWFEKTPHHYLCGPRANISHSRLLGIPLQNDFTGGCLERMYKAESDREIFLPIYELSNEVRSLLKGGELRRYDHELISNVDVGGVIEIVVSKAKKAFGPLGKKKILEKLDEYYRRATAYYQWNEAPYVEVFYDIKKVA